MRLALALALGLAATPCRAEPALRIGIETGNPPFSDAGGPAGAQGFAVDLFRAIGERLHRPVDFVSEPGASLFHDLQAGRIDAIAGPVAANPERASELLFGEGYVWSAFMLVAPADRPLATVDALRGRRLAVQSGTPYAEWADRHAGKLGFSPVMRPDVAAVIAAVLQGEADAALAGSPSMEAAVHAHPELAAGPVMSETKEQAGPVFGQGGTELREDVEQALGCLKRDGTVASLARRWIGVEPGSEDLERLITPGSGIPGLAGYDPKPRKIVCR